MFEDIFTKKKNISERPKPKIVADIHEKNSLVIAELMGLGADVEFQSLKVADYLVKDVAIERKTVSDFISSMINKRLMRQLEEIKQYSNCLLLIEGETENLYSGGIHENAIRGFLLSILLGYEVPIVFTKDSRDSAKFLLVLARKEEKEHVSIRAKKRTLSKKEQKQFILEGFEGIGPASAKKLIKRFGTIRNVINASEEELEKILKNRAKDFRELLNE